MSTGETQQGFPKIQAPLCNNDLTINQTWLQLLITLWNRTGGGPGASINEALMYAVANDALARHRDDQQSSSGGSSGFSSDVLSVGGAAGGSQIGFGSDILADPPIPPPDPLLGTLFDQPPGVTEEGIHLSDFTTVDVSISKHGFAPKLPNDATKYLDGTGHYTVPAGSGSGTVTSISQSTGIALTPNPITTTGSVAIADTAVTPGTYGDSTHVSQITVDQQGRLTAASNVAITGSGSVTSVSAGTGITCTPDPITTTGTVKITDTAVTPATYGDATHVGQFTVNQQGQLTAASSVAITFPASGDISPFSDDSITKPAAADFTIADDTTAGHGTGSKANLATRGVELTNTRGSASTTQSLFYEAAVSNTLVTMIAYIEPNFQETNSDRQYFYGLAVRDNAGKIDSFGLTFRSGLGCTEWTRGTFTNISTAPTFSSQTGGHMATGRPIWFRLQKVSTNFVFSVSYNGETYTTIYTGSATNFVGATLNDVGLILYNGLAAGTEIVNLDVFSFTKS